MNEFLMRGLPGSGIQKLRWYDWLIVAYVLITFVFLSYLTKGS
jgi:hypothetical protein